MFRIFTAKQQQQGRYSNTKDVSSSTDPGTAVACVPATPGVPALLLDSLNCCLLSSAGGIPFVAVPPYIPVHAVAVVFVDTGFSAVAANPVDPADMRNFAT